MEIDSIMIICFSPLNTKLDFPAKLMREIAEYFSSSSSSSLNVMKKSHSDEQQQQQQQPCYG